MSLLDLFGKISVLSLHPGDEQWHQINQKRKISSKLAGDESRRMRNAQSAIARDIRNTRKALRKSTADQAGALQSHLAALKDLQSHMRQSRQVDGHKYYNVKAERLDALNEYLTKYKGKTAREVSLRNPSEVMGRTPIDNRMYENLKTRLGESYSEEYEVQLEDLLEEYYDAVRSYDYERSLEVLSKMRGTRKSIEDMYADVKSIVGTTDYDGR